MLPKLVLSELRNEWSSGMNFYSKGVRKQIKNNWVVFDILDMSTDEPTIHQNIEFHMVFNLNIHFRGKLII